MQSAFDISYYLLSGEDMTSFLALFVPFVGWGLGLGAVFWMVGHVVWFVIDALRF